MKNAALYLFCLLCLAVSSLGCDEASSSNNTDNPGLEIFLAFDNPPASAVRNASQEVLAIEFFNRASSRSYVVKSIDLEADASDNSNSGYLTNVAFANHVNIRAFLGTGTTPLHITPVVFGANKKVTITLTTQILVPARTSVRVKFLINSLGASIQTNNNDSFALKVNTASVEITGTSNPDTPLIGPPVTGNKFTYTS